MFKNSLAYNKYYSLENKKNNEQRKRKKWLQMWQTLRVTYHKTNCCERKFCYFCILYYFEENLKISGFPIKCPIHSCESFLGFDLVQEALKPEDFDNLMKHLRLCSGCMNYKPKHSMTKTGVKTLNKWWHRVNRNLFRPFECQSWMGEFRGYRRHGEIEAFEWSSGECP